MASMKLSLLLLAWGFAALVQCEEKADPNTVQYSYSYSSKPVVTSSHTSYSVGHSVSVPVQTHQVIKHVDPVHHVQHIHHVAPKPQGHFCPASHPFAYYSGSYCCKYGREKVYRPQGWKCDGSVIGFTSLCCLNDGHVGCPAGHGKCRNYGG
eukprot:UN21549